MLECTPTPGAPAHMTREARPLSSDNALALLHTSQVSKTSRCNNSRSRRHRAHSQGTESQGFDEIETFDTTRETRDRRAPASTYVRVHRQTCYLVQKRKSNRGGRSAESATQSQNTVSCARCALCFHSSSTVSSGPLISVLDQSASFRTLPINERPPAHRSCSHIALVEEQACMALGASPSNTALKLHSRAVVPLCRLDHCRGSMRC